MIKFKLSTKILIYFLLVSLGPLLVTNFLLVTTANRQQLKAASIKQQAVANYLSESVGGYLTNNIGNLKYLSQLYSSGDITESDLNKNLAIMFNQNSDLQRLTITDVKGKEQIAFDNNGKLITLDDGSGSDAFKAVNFLAGKAFVSSVEYNDKNDPVITIAIPILKSNFGDYLNNLDATDFGTYHTPDDIKGTVIAKYNIKNLWKTVLSTKIGEGGYAYVVDGLSNLVAHPDSNFVSKNKKLSDVDAAKQFIAGNFDTRETTSETGQSVVSTPRVIPDSGWAVIVEEPVSSIYASVDSYIKLAATLGLVAVALSILLSVFFRRQITEPIKKLSKGAFKFGRGDFDHVIDIKSKDELQDLADTFNGMGLNIKKLITQLRTNNLKIVTEKAKLANIISSVTDGIIALDKDGIIVSINPPAANLANKNPDDLIGKSITEAIKWEHNNEPLAMELTKPGTYEYPDITLSRGEQMAFLDLVVSIIDRKDSDVAVIVTVHDLTKSRELDFMKLDFVAIAAHELRTPLTVVQGYLDILNTEGRKQLSIFNLENLQKIIHSTNELRDLINKLLNIARIERGEMEIFIEKLNISKQVRENVHQHEASAIQNDIVLTYTDHAEGYVYVPADSSSITEVLNNLIGNAIKFTGKDGEVRVSLRVIEDEVRIEVSDNGPGVPDELHSKLFSKFYRAERSMISGTRGTGLGLFISKTIIELQKGKIGIMPSHGKGSTFYFTLPLYNSDIHDRLVTKNKQAGGVHGWFKKNTSSRG